MNQKNFKQEISQYLPAQLSEEELRLEISKIIQETGLLQ